MAQGRIALVGPNEGYSEGDSSTTLTPGEWPNMALDPDTFGLTICSLVRDSYFLAKDRGHRPNRYWRLATTMYLLITCISIQVFLLSQVKRFVSAKAVHDVRIAYDVFEQAMYGGNTWNMSVQPKLERRGIGGKAGAYFNASRFDDLDADEQAAACRIPLSQPWFFFTVLYIWSLTCIAEIRKCKELFMGLMMGIPRVESMADALTLIEEDGLDADSSPMVISGLPGIMKVILFVFVIFPRFCITTFLLWVGCRWLLATTNFSDIILNAVALEFILCLKDLLYLAVVPRRNVLAVENLFVHIEPERESMWAFLSIICWTVLPAIWVLAYMGFPGHNGLQQVLRDYQWDVHDVCVDWILARFAV
eukprot:CAMPEP_0176197838 /NCGR_PEP_ID=MMETSP0121_2-20121125/7747_1 /TAXON_ID=160619 /ORGANISM="Kryptoperidinium foliaceum, Strain CCMP 1326" /LENGTH=362 /DNA_ID=CAMNT_0017536677 /DNA_START=86 /DNA_END=1174 /DNA_ORIENTATION=-